MLENNTKQKTELSMPAPYNTSVVDNLEEKVYYYCKRYFKRSKTSTFIRKDIFESIEFRTLNYLKKSNNKNQSVLLQIHDISEAQ